MVVSVLPRLKRVLCSPGIIRQLLAGAAAAGAAACPARCGPGPVLVRQRDDIVVDARLQLLDLLGCRLGSEDALCLGHRCIRHCCRGGGSVLPRTEGRGSWWLLRAPLHVPHLSPRKGHKAPPCPCGAPAGSPVPVNPVSELTGWDQQRSALGHSDWQQNSDPVWSSHPSHQGLLHGSLPTATTGLARLAPPNPGRTGPFGTGPCYYLRRLSVLLLPAVPG